MTSAVLSNPAFGNPANLDGLDEDVAPSTNTNVLVQYWDFQDTINEGATSSRDSQGPTYSKCQETALETFSSPSMICCTCYEHFRPSDAIRLKCNDIFCRGCLRRLIMKSLEDKTMFPPKCHREALSQQMIAGLLSQDELADFKDTEIEMSCSNRTYCSNSKCGKFIPPSNIIADRASCARCRASTCTNCRNEYHEDDCPEDPLLQATLALAADQKWQRCYACQAIAILAKGCNHIT